MHEYWKKLLKIDLEKSEADINFPLVAVFIIRFEKLLSALSKIGAEAPDKAYIILSSMLSRALMAHSRAMVEVAQVIQFNHHAE